MRKFLLLRVVLFFVAVSVIAGCGKNPFEIQETGTTDTVRLKIYRSVRFDSDPFLLILAKEVNLNYSERVITVKGLTNITGSNDNGWRYRPSWTVHEIKFQDDILIINIPKDSAYTVYIKKQYHYLPVLK